MSSTLAPIPDLYNGLDPFLIGAVAGICGVAWQLGWTIVYACLRRRAMIRRRGWVWVCLSSLAGTWHLATLATEIMLDRRGSMPCLFVVYSAYMFVPLWIFPHLIRAHYLVQSYRHGLRRVHSRTDQVSYTRLCGGGSRPCAQHPTQAAWLIAVALVTLSGATILQFSTARPEPYWSDNPHGGCYQEQVYYIGALGIVAVILIAVAGAAAWRAADPVHMRREFLLQLVCGGPFFLLWVVGSSVGTYIFPPWLLNTYFVWLMIISIHAVSVVVPVWWTLRTHHPGREPAVESTTTSLELEDLIKSTEKICTDPRLLESLKLFCVQNWCVENLLFYLDAEAFRATYPAGDARHIIKLYVQPGGDLEINITAKARNDILCGGVHADMFANARAEVERNIHSDTLPRWRRSEVFQRAISVYPVIVTGGYDSSELLTYSSAPT